MGTTTIGAGRRVLADQSAQGVTQGHLATSARRIDEYAATGSSACRSGQSSINS